MAAMGAGDVVDVLAQMQADADGAGLLAGIEMHEAGDRAIGELDMHPLLELADGLHLPIGAQEIVATELEHLAIPPMISSLLELE